MLCVLLSQAAPSEKGMKKPLAISSRRGPRLWDWDWCGGGTGTFGEEGFAPDELEGTGVDDIGDGSLRLRVSVGGVDTDGIEGLP